MQSGLGVCTAICKHISILSFDNQKNILFARSIFTDANIFIFDEPTRSIDIPTKIQIYNIMNELVRVEKGILFISSNLPELIGMCDRILVIYNGSIVKEVYSKDTNKAQLLSYALGVL